VQASAGTDAKAAAESVHPGFRGKAVKNSGVCGDGVNARAGRGRNFRKTDATILKVMVTRAALSEGGLEMVTGLGGN